MIRTQTLRAVLVLAASLAPTLPAVAAETDFEAAQALYERCHWAQAFDAFSRLADAGDPQAARIAALMARHGPALYAQRFDPPLAQVQRWLWTARAAVDPQR